MNGKACIMDVQRLSKYFTMSAREGQTIRGCDSISFDVAPGEFVGISGPSGIGKSTVVKCIYRTYIPTRGQLVYDSPIYGPIDLARASERQILALRAAEIGYVSQFLRVLPRISTLDLVAGGLRKRGWGLKAARQEAASCLEKFHLDSSIWDAYPAFLSGGQQQRVNLARVVALRPRLLLLDEPTASLDASSKAAVVKALKELKNQGTSTIGVFHDMDTMGRLADRVVTFNERGGTKGTAVQEVI